MTVAGQCAVARQIRATIQVTTMARNRFKQPECPNCGARFAEAGATARFCSGCGQENHDLNMPIRHLLGEAVEGWLHLDTRTLRTMRALAFRPGFLTVEFLRGRRARYSTPVHLYILVSFIFFLILAIFSGGHAAGKETDTGSKRNPINITFKGISTADLRNITDSELDGLISSRNIPPTRFNRYAIGQLARIGRGGQAELRNVVINSVSRMMFVLMPVFALLLFLFFRKAEPNYISSLVFSLHYHSFAFLLLAVLSIVSGLFKSEIFIFLAPIGIVTYLFFALKTAYGGSSTGTLIRTSAIAASHVFMVALLFAATLIVRILLF